MKRRYSVVCMIIILLLTILLLSCSNKGTTDASGTSLLVSSAASLSDVMGEIKELYQKENENISIIYNFAGSGSLQQQIEQGAPVDIFISAAPRQMNELQKRNLILDSTRIDLLMSKVVLIVPANSFTEINSFDLLLNDSIKTIAIGEPESVPAGRYAQEIFGYLNMWEDLQPKLIYAKDVRQVLTWVETNNIDAGVVYMTDTLGEDKVKVLVEALDGSHSPVIYPAAIIRESKEVAAAEDFLKFLAEDEAKDIFEKYGFKALVE